MQANLPLADSGHAGDGCRRRRDDDGEARSFAIACASLPLPCASHGRPPVAFAAWRMARPWPAAWTWRGGHGKNDRLAAAVGSVRAARRLSAAPQFLAPCEPGEPESTRELAFL